ncbi:uncharacterized protein [Choristoneura fumiferana]|uniref:uncharacterized protein n=1 Tax=Choristoneura fumiferana TaxID=7141 RepID=UPI003D158EF4
MFVRHRKNPVPQRSLSRTESKIDTKVNLKSESAVFENYVDNNLDQLEDKPVDREDGTATPENENIDQFESVSSDDSPKIVENEIVDVMDFSSHHLGTPTASRPQTPNSVSSRPMTPRAASRPGTPVHPVQRPGTPCSRPTTPKARPQPSPNKQPLARPNTPNHTTTNQARPRTPSNLPVPTARVQRNPNHPTNEGDIKSTFSAKQRQFQMMKKELDLKQQAVLEVFDSLRNLRDRMSREGLSGGGEGALPQELVVFNVADWTADEVAQLCRDAASSSNTDGAVEFFKSVPDECTLEELDAKVLDIPAQFADLCLQAFSARQELIDWVKELVTTYSQEDGRGETMQRVACYNARGLELCEALRELKSRSEDAVDAIANFSKRVCREQSALIAVGKSLVREVARLRQDLDSRASVIEEMRHHSAAGSDLSKELEETRQELEEEKCARLAIKDKLSTTEYQLRQTRVRVTKMDRQLREAEASISSLTGTVKTLEDQSRQREVQLEARARKLKESLKTGEVASGQLAQHRDALQAEVLDLKEQIEKMTAEHKSAISNLNAQLKDLKSALEEQHQITQKELDSKIAAETALTESLATIEELKSKITELENCKPNPELPTEREMDLWAELQATKETLRATEDEVTACKREKVRFLETLTKIAESENKVGLQQKLAAELLNKEEIIGKMQIQIRDLTKNIKLNEQKVIQYESYVRDLQAHNRAVANCQEAPDGISYQDLQQEIMNLRMGLLEAVHRNEELSEVLAQKEQQLEQQDKTSRAQARVIKVNKQIAAKAEEIQELFSTLENKQQQIHRLEKIVLALEEQQRRAQAQRTRHEEKIAALEHELAAGANRRERKFLFF